MPDEVTPGKATQTQATAVPSATEYEPPGIAWDEELPATATVALACQPTGTSDPVCLSSPAS